METTPSVVAKPFPSTQIKKFQGLYYKLLCGEGVLDLQTPSENLKQDIVVCRLKAGISESERASIARQCLGNHVSCITVWVTKHVHMATYT
jgi:hypothetical protein